MQTILKKLKLIYVPYLIISIAFIVLYSLITWLLFYKFSVFSIREDILQIWLPLALPWILILIWLSRRIRLLVLTGANGNKPFLYQLVVWGTMAIPAIITQNYLESASGDLLQLDNIHEIVQREPVKYYTLKHFYIDKRNATARPDFVVSGKYNEDLNMHFYVAVPILKDQADTMNGTCYGWLGREYSKRISNRLDSKEKEESYKAFALQTEKNFEQEDLTQFVYLNKVGNSEAGAVYREAIKSSTRFIHNDSPVFIPVNAPFEQRNGNTFAWIFGALGISACLFLAMVLIPQFNESEVDRFERSLPPEENELKEIFDLFIPTTDYFVTPILINLNLLVFIVMVCSGLGFISFKGPDLLQWGGNFRPLTTTGEWWRLVTCMFLHGGLMHILANMMGLLFVGIFLEPVLGRTKFLIAYLLTGILASCVSLWWYEATVSVGASGAIFGLYGVFLALLLLKVFPAEFGKVFLVSTLIFIGYNLLIGIMGGVDNAAHIGGLVSGLLLGLAFYPAIKKEMEEVEDLDF
ncbi:rhomboid family intramembrane serine protease [Xanthocytophaga agilis]|uniref:Rhomboid family intramembrane serine protease n=1 Tax=Xanthocytophaga agilis TaxID=3048010 RepID=A0AAE3UFL1_9BACT|nr:rhomboid family intramembrane serine protease [Xanthocytophaga agilis]MDJ1500688.1 rhomboid family intramembrane serine protease [Xanthocytophaga agilis]